MITVKGTCVSPAPKEGGIVNFRRWYINPTGLECRETRTVTAESDYFNSQLIRESADNGRTWSDWQPVARTDYSVMYGPDEMTTEYTNEIWNPVHGHYVSTVFTRYFIDGHEKAYHLFWSEAAQTCLDHQGIAIRLPGEDKPSSETLIRYEDGAEFDPENPRNPEFLYKNPGFLNAPIVLDDGDIAVPVGATVRVGCRIAGLDVNRVFPSCPDIHRCVIVARGHFNAETQRYDFTFSNPIILGDLRSSRGIDEPVLAQLRSGRMILVMRGSNVQSKNWRTRIEPGTPSFKWFAYSDDGGKTFTDPEPWRFDDREVIYSGATISEFIRSSRNGKLYWIGNISDHTAHDNWPRFPLNIVEVDETTGLAKKESLTIIDTRREGETEQVQLSNWSLMEDRETGCFELCLCKYGQFDAKKPYFGETWRYQINPGE